MIDEIYYTEHEGADAIDFKKWDADCPTEEILEIRAIQNENGRYTDPNVVIYGRRVHALFFIFLDGSMSVWDCVGGYRRSTPYDKVSFYNMFKTYGAMASYL